MTPSAIVHDFAERLAYSAELSDEPSWVEFYSGLWPQMITCVRIDKNSKWQKWGVDRMVLLPEGRQILIDEKKRERNKKTGIIYDDFLCEEYSVLEKQKVGWTLDESKQCDFIAYAIPEIKKCYMLPFELLRLTCLQNLQTWKSNRAPCDAQNNGYRTRNWPVKWQSLFDAMRREMTRSYDGSRLVLPTGISESPQLNFEWGPEI